MKKIPLVEFVVEAGGSALTICNVQLDAGSLDGDGEGTPAEGRCIKNGHSDNLRASGFLGTGTRGSLSVFAGFERVGTLNWDWSVNPDENVVDWTPLSKNFRASLMDDVATGGLLSRVRLRVARSLSRDASVSRLGASAGHLGFAGI